MSNERYVEFTIATSRVNRLHFDLLERKGVPRRFLMGAAMRFGIDEIAPCNDGSFQPIDGGQRVIVVPTLPLLAPWEWQDGDDIEDIGDLVAFRPSDPSRWWVRTGATPILNPDAITGAQLNDEPLSVFSSPLAWMQASGAGVVILDPLAHLGLWFGSVREIIADSVELGREIDRRLRQPKLEVPKIMIPNIRRAA